LRRSPQMDATTSLPVDGSVPFHNS
jgi:hypothetical protein